jgi:hypothetical protein
MAEDFPSIWPHPPTTIPIYTTCIVLKEHPLILKIYSTYFSVSICFVHICLISVCTTILIIQAWTGLAGKGCRLYLNHFSEDASIPSIKWCFQWRKMNLKNVADLFICLIEREYSLPNFSLQNVSSYCYGANNRLHDLLLKQSDAPNYSRRTASNFTSKIETFTWLAFGLVVVHLRINRLLLLVVSE